MQQILDILPTGRENAMTATEIMNLLNYDNFRDVTKAIHNLRIKGHIICASGEGYYLPASDTDIKNFYRKTSNRIAEIQAALKPVEDYLYTAGSGGE